MENKGELFEKRVHGTESFPCGMYQSKGSTLSHYVKYHWHKECEIIYFRKGDFLLGVNMEKYEVKEESIYFINQEELHNITCTKAPFEELAFVFHTSILRFMENDEGEKSIIEPFIDQQIMFPRCVLSGEKAFAKIKEELLQAQAALKNEKRDASMETTTNPVSQLLLKASFIKIMAYLEEYHLLTENREIIDPRVGVLKKVISFIEQKYQEKIYVNQLAKLANMNEQYFCRFFKKSIGKTPIEYVNEYRIKKAKHLLKDTELSVMEVCMETGFNNLGNFMREFRKYNQTTPLQYRNSFSYLTK
ncbi:MAG: AraC family transcriptional regulator [Acetivibrio sp.]